MLAILTMEWDARLLRALLGSANAFDAQLAAALERFRVTSAGLDAARAQVAPHRLDLTDVTAHAACEAKGCPLCGQTGVAQASTGEPLQRRPPASRSAQLAEMAQAQRAQASAQAKLRELARLFGQVADVLERAARHARELERTVKKLIP